jgi:hypothetical protein
MESIGQRVGGKIQKTEDGGQTTIADLGLGIGDWAWDTGKKVGGWRSGLAGLEVGGNAE